MKPAQWSAMIFALITGLSISSTAQVASTPVVHTTDEAVRLFEADLEALSQLQFEQRLISPNHRRFFESTDGAGLVAFIRRHISTVQYSVSLAGNLAAMAFPGNFVIVGDSFFAAPQVVRWGYLIHEARHTDARNQWGHVNCPNPYSYTLNSLTYELPSSPNAGRVGACDESDEGAYGYEFTFLVSIFAACQDCAPAMRDRAMTNAMTDTLVYVTNSAAAERLVRESTPFANAIFERFPVLMQHLEEGYRRSQSR